MSIRGLSQALVAALVAALFSIMPFATPQALAAPNPAAISYNNNVCDLSTAGYDGDGSSGDPYQISDSDALWEVADCDVTNSSQAHFVLTKDIDVRQATTANTSSPIGFTGSNTVYSFSGSLNGQNYRVSNISISSSTRGVGLFEFLNSATISNLAVHGQITSTKTDDSDMTDGTGGLAGESAYSILLVSISNYVNVSGKLSTGGLIGYANGPVEIRSSQNHADVDGSYVANSDSFGSGGLIGYANSNVVVNTSDNFGLISGDKGVGGLLGRTAGIVNILQSTNQNQVSAADGMAGGFVGDAKSGLTIDNSLNAGIVFARQIAGGLLGNARGSLVINSSTNSGDVSASGVISITRLGGFAGVVAADATVSNSVNVGHVTGLGARVGGLIGEVFRSMTTITASLNDSKNSGNVSSSNDDVGGLIGFAQSSRILIGQTAGVHNSGHVSGANYVGGFLGRHSTNDVFLVVASSNSGTISATQDSAGGLVGESQGADIDTFMNSGNVEVGSSYGGGLIGRAKLSTTISNSANIGDVDVGGDGAGGFIGSAEKATRIINSLNNSTVDGNQYVGGFVGDALEPVSITRSYVAGTVSGTSDVDGLLGDPTPSITTASAFTSVPSAHTATSSLEDMRQASTFTGFDFDTVWGFGTCNDNNGLPMLRVFGELVSYSSTSCTVVPQNNQQNNQQQIAEPVAHVAPKIPIFDAVFTASPGSEVLVTGREFDLFVSIAADGNLLTISAQTTNSLVLSIPALSPGVYDLVALTRNAGVTYLGQLQVIESTLQAEELNEIFITGLNPRSSWLNRGALDQLASISPAAASVTCLAYQDRQGVAARQKALSRAEHACRGFKERGFETKVVAYSKAPTLASRLKLLFSN